MKKFLLTAALVLALVTSLTAGTMAFYSADVATLTSGIRTKEFSVSTTKTNGSFSDALEIIPGESVTYTIDVTNEGEVDAVTTVGASLDYLATIPGLSVTVTNAEGNVISLTRTPARKDVVNFDSRATSEIKAGDTDFYTVKVSWLDGSKWTEAQTDEYDNEQITLTININAIQSKSSEDHVANLPD